MSSEHLIRKAILICQTSALADSLSDGEIMSAIKHVYDSLAGGRCATARTDRDNAKALGKDFLFNL